MIKFPWPTVHRPPALNNSEIPYQELYSILVEVVCFFDQNIKSGHFPKTISPLSAKFQMDIVKTHLIEIE